MSDIRNLDLKATDGGVKVNTLVRNCIPLEASTTYNQEFVGFFANVGAATDWTITGIDAKTTVAFTPQNSTIYNIHLSAITLPAGATGHGYLPGYAVYLVDAINDWTVDGDGTATGGLFTVQSSNGSSALTSASSVLPVVGASYNYSITVDSFTAATKALVTYGGVDIYDKAAADTYIGVLTATAATGLEVDIDVVTTEDFVISDITITRA